MEDLFEEYMNNKPQRLCKKCGKCCKSFQCEHIGGNNLCLIYENRPQACKNFPYSPWNSLPKDCGFEGWLFQIREEIKQGIRKQKELLLSLEILLKTAPAQEVDKLTESIERIKKIIEIYAKYGSKDW